MLDQHIALVPEAGGVNASELARVCAALQKQLNRDLAPVWRISATINAFPYLEDVPLGYWPIVVTLCELGDEAGVQIDRSGQPYAQVEMSPDWSVHASRACLDMLVNPFGRRMIAGSSPRPDQGPVEFLVEVCGPCTGGDAAYVIDDILVSDFCTPAYWGSSVSPGNVYSFAGTIQGAQQVSAGGHLIWHDPISDNWWLRHHVADALLDRKLGPIDGRVSAVREAVRARAPHCLGAAKMTIEDFEARLGVRRQHALQASQFQAHRLRSLVASTTEFDRRELEMGSTQGGLRNRRSPAMLTGRASFPDRNAPNGAEPSTAVDDEVLVEVTPDDFLGYDPRSDQPAAVRGAVTPTVDSNERAPVRSRPPPLPVKPRPAPTPAVQTFVAGPPADSPGAAPPPQSLAPQNAPPPISTIPPPIVVSYPPSTATSPKPRFNAWLVGASAVAGAATVMLAAVVYLGAEPGQPTNAQAAPPAWTPATTIVPSPTSPVSISPPTSALAAPPAQPNAAAAVASATVDHPEAAASGSPAVARPITSVAAAPANRSPTSKPARPAVAQPPAPRARTGRTPDEPAPDALDGLIVERR